MGDYNLSAEDANLAKVCVSDCSVNHVLFIFSLNIRCAQIP